jgi:HAD superfamily hydrolase (TIGR01549 family)
MEVQWTSSGLKQSWQVCVEMDWHGRRLKGVVFDLDGTLTDSIEIYYQVFEETCTSFGIRVTREDVLAPLAEGIEFWDQVLPMDVPDRDEKIRQCRKHSAQGFRDALDVVRPVPGVQEVLEALDVRGVRIGLVTDSREASLRPLHSHSLMRYFTATITRDDGFPRKPEPEGIIECLRRMGISPINALMVGDSLLDIRAGKGAGTLTIGVLSGLASRRQFRAEEPTALVEDVTEVLSVLDIS